MKNTIGYIALIVVLMHLQEINSGLKDCSADGLYAMGKNFSDHGLYHRALPYLRAALLKDPNFKQARFQLARTHIACHHFAKGFSLMHDYFSEQEPLAKPWNGEDIFGKKLLVRIPRWPEADISNFVGFLAYLKEQGAALIVAVNTYITTIFGDNNQVIINSGCGYDYHSRSEGLDYDYEVHLMSLPTLLANKAMVEVVESKFVLRSKK